MPTLSEAASKQLLAQFGVPVLDERTARDVDAAVSAAEALGYPVVVKLCGEAIAHKTERGLVRLGLRNEDAVRLAAAQLLDQARPEDGAVELLVAPMVQGTREFIAGLVRDDAQQMEGGRVVQVRPQNLSVAGLGLIQPARIVMPDGELQGLLYVPLQPGGVRWLGHAKS